jgi:hypothetical protein
MLKYLYSFFSLLVLILPGCVCFELERGKQPLPPSVLQTTQPASGPIVPDSSPNQSRVKESETRATLKGRLNLKGSRPLNGHLVLAIALPTNKPTIFILEIDDKKLHLASMTPQGDFIFKDIVPGKYGIMIWNPLTAASISDPKTGKTLFVDILPNQVLDLGLLEIPFVFSSP